MAISNMYGALLQSVHHHPHHFWVSTTQLVEVGMPTLVCQTQPRPEDLGIRRDALLTIKALNRCILHTEIFNLL